MQTRPPTSSSAVAYRPWHMFALAFVWSLLNWWVQDQTTLPTIDTAAAHIALHLATRFLLNFGFALAIIACGKRAILWSALALNVLLSGVLLSYHHFFHRALSWTTLQTQVLEGLAVATVSGVALGSLLLLIPLAAILVGGIGDRLQLALGFRPKALATGALVWTMSLLFLAFPAKAPKSAEIQLGFRDRTTEDTDSLATLYGYTLTWAFQSVYVDYADLSAHAQERRSEPVERLIEHVAPYALSEQVAVIQVESLDLGAMGWEVEGQEVIPNLNRWAQAGNFMELQSPKGNGSCDADYTFLLGGLPPTAIAPYYITTFPFQDALPERLRQAGYRTLFHHGVTGTYFSRNEAYAQMGWDVLHFAEDLSLDYDRSSGAWLLPDELVFEDAVALRPSEGPFFQFIITETSHTPFNFLARGYESPLTGTQRLRAPLDGYARSMHYVDTELAKYIDTLSPGTDVIIYGDHWAEIEADENYQPTMHEDFGLVPAILFRIGPEREIIPLFTAPPEALAGEDLRLADLAHWFHQSCARLR